jgi:hypothetical protein
MGHVPPEVEEFLIAGRNPPRRGAPPGQCAGQGRRAGSRRRQGETLPLDPAWDEGLIADLLAARLDRFAAMEDAEIRAAGAAGMKSAPGRRPLRRWMPSALHGAKALLPPDRRVDRRHGPRFAQPEGAA